MAATQDRLKSSTVYGLLYVMLSPDDKVKLLALAQRAAAKPLDYRNLFNTAGAKAVRDAMIDLSLNLGTLTIAFAYENMPPLWGVYRHLSISDAGKPVDDEVFYEIAQIVGMGDTSTWDHMLVQVIKRHIPFASHVKHAIQPVPKPVIN